MSTSKIVPEPEQTAVPPEMAEELLGVILLMEETDGRT